MVERGIRIANGIQTRLLIGHGNEMEMEMLWIKGKITGNGNGIGNAMEKLRQDEIGIRNGKIAVKDRN